MMLLGVRHGQCERQGTNGKYKDDNVALNATGINEMAQCADWIRQHWIRDQSTRLCLWVSPLPRAIQSANLLRDFIHTHPDWEVISARIDERLSNKQGSDDLYDASLKSFLRDLRQDPHHCVHLAVTHGRVLKMLESLQRLGKIDPHFTDGLPDRKTGHVYVYDVSKPEEFPTEKDLQVPHSAS